MQDSESRHTTDLTHMPSEPKYPSLDSSGSSAWDVNTSESHIFQGTSDWKPGSVRAMIGRHIFVENIQHRRYDRVHLYVNPKVGRTMIKHDCLSEVADWIFTPGKGYDIKWTVFGHTFVLPGIDFVCDPALDVDGVFGYDFVEEFSHFFFKAWPSGLVQPSRFCIANPLFHPVNVDKVLRVYTAVQVGASVIGVGVFFGPEAGLNMWIPQFGTQSKVSNLCVWQMPELAEFDALCITLSTVLKVARSGEYLQIEFHVSSQRLVSLMKIVGISSEGAELIVYHFDNAMRFLDLRKEFAMQNSAVENDCIRILPYANNVSAKQAQRLAELATMCLPEPEDPLEDSHNFYFKFLTHRKSARACKRLVKDTFRTILEDYSKSSTTPNVSNTTVLNRTLGQLEKGCRELSTAGELVTQTLPFVNEMEKDPAKSLKGVKGGAEIRSKELQKSGKLYIPPQLRVERGTDQKLSVPGAESQKGEDTVGDMIRMADLLVTDAHMEAQKTRENAIREAEDMLEDAYRNARIIRQFAASGTQHTGGQAQSEIPLSVEREKILSEAYREAHITMEKAEKMALRRAEIIMHGVMQKEKSMLAEAAKIINDARKEEKIILNEARVQAEKEALVRISYAQGQADLKIRVADHTMKQAEEVGGKVHTEMLALEEKKRLEERHAGLIKKVQVRATAQRRSCGIVNAEASEDTREVRRVIEKIDSDAKAQAEEIIESARKIQKEIHEKEKEIERIKADGKAEVEKIKKDAETKTRREIAQLMKKARADADAERERIKKDIEIAMRLEMENEQEKVRKGIGERAKHDAEQIIAQAKKKAEEFEKQMEALKHKTEQDCSMERKKLEEFVSSQRKKEKGAQDAAECVLEKARARADELVQVAQGNLDMVPILGDVLSSALPITPELFLEVFFGSSDDNPPLSAEEFARKLESSKKGFTLGQLINHNVEGARLFLEECHRKGRLAYEIELYVDEKRDRRLKYKKGKRLLPLMDLGV